VRLLMRVPAHTSMVEIVWLRVRPHRHLVARSHARPRRVDAGLTNERRSMMNSTANVETPEVDDFLSCLTPRQLVAIKDQCRVHAFAARERILVEGEPSRAALSRQERPGVRGHQGADRSISSGPERSSARSPSSRLAGAPPTTSATESVVAWSLARVHRAGADAGALGVG
jgi:hypothetical protein